MFSAIVRVSTTSTLAIGELEMITVEEREAIRRAYYLDRKSKRQIAREQGHSRKTIDKAVRMRRLSPTDSANRKLRRSSVPSRRELMHCSPKMTIFPASNSTLLTRSLNSSKRRATRAVSRGCACTSPSGTRTTEPPRSFCLWNLNQAKMPRWTGGGHRDHRRGQANGADLCHVVVSQQTALCHGFSEPEARELLLRAHLRI